MSSLDLRANISEVTYDRGTITAKTATTLNWAIGRRNRKFVEDRDIVDRTLEQRSIIHGKEFIGMEGSRVLPQASKRWSSSLELK